MEWNLYKYRNKMIEQDKNYWLYIYPHVYCRVNTGQTLLYNTQNGATLESASEEIIALIGLLHEKKNMGAISVEGVLLLQEPYRRFVMEFCDNDMGGLSDVSFVPEKPIQLMPVLNLQRDVEKLQKDTERSIGENVLHYLSELNVYISQTCHQQCLYCDSYFRQNLCCTKNIPETALPNTQLEKLLQQVTYAPVGKLNILGGNILQYSHWSDLQKLLGEFQKQAHLWVHYANVAGYGHALPSFQYDVPVVSPVDEQKFGDCAARLKDKKAHYHFFITGEEEYEQATQLGEKNGIQNYTIRPFYTKDNLRFFEEQVYVNKDDIFAELQTMRSIFAHQKLNTNAFGSLTILTDGSVHTNVNKPFLGNIAETPIINLIQKEMEVNTAWRIIRDKAPCNECLYQYLCPSPSNYEWAIGKVNLCHIAELNR